MSLPRVRRAGKGSKGTASDRAAAARNRQVGHFSPVHRRATGLAWSASERLMDLGVDGIIADYPTRLRTLMVERGLKLPKATR